ncbi:MAG: archaetidylserine decarboxylase [Proteobacteria bacterium]|nr:archaetidylserine decarboxylase [Pseudomonadota bacterium]
MDFQQVRRLWGTGSAYSALIGFCAQARVPSSLRSPAYRAFAHAVGANLDETELALDAYPTLGEFFARKLRDGARVVDPAPNTVISPCDGVIAARGRATAGTLVQAKGRNYQVAELVADAEYATRLTDGEYVTIYLAPRDYHRVHAPIDARITGYDFVPGALWPVNPRVAALRDQLLSRNERVVIRLELSNGTPCALVMVGAAGVGNMRLAGWANGFQSVDLRLQGERRAVELTNVVVRRGDELGAFNLGSTVVMVFGSSGSSGPSGSSGSPVLHGEVGTAVRFGEALGEVRPTV